MNKSILVIVMFVIFCNISYAQTIFDFRTLPSFIETNIDAYPVTMRVPMTVNNVTVNDIAVELLSAYDQYDIFSVVDLTLGSNDIRVEIFHNNGTTETITKDVYLNPTYSTADEELIYAQSRYRDNNSVNHYGVLVIDVRKNYFIGVIRDKTIKGITKNGSEIFFSTGGRYSTSNHSYTGMTLPNYGSGYILLFSNDQNFVYHKSRRYNLSTNAYQGDILPASVGGDADITSDDTGIITRTDYINLSSNTQITRDYDYGRRDIFGSLAVDTNDSYVFHTSYAYASGELNILHINGSWIKDFTGLSDYAGGIVFSPDGEKGYVGFYGNTYYGKGGILIIDMDTLSLDKDFYLYGARSLAMADGNRLFASAFHTYNVAWLGNPNIRGIVELNPINDGADLGINNIFFVNLYSTDTDNYYGDHYIFHKPGTSTAECYSNFDCGDNEWLGSPSCVINNSYQDYLSYECVNPGTDSAYCTNSTDFILKEECEFGCSSGVCNNKPISTGNVKVIGRDLYVDGKEYTVKAVGYSPVPIGYSPDGGYDVTVHPELRQRDFPLLQAMNCNSIRTWGKVGQESFLDDAWNYSIRVIMGFWLGPEKDFQNDTIRQDILLEFETYVTNYKHHPAVLVWAIGNEENYFYGGSDPEKHAAYFSLVNEMAKKAYEIEGSSYHPVVALALEMPGQFATVGNEQGGSDDSSIPYVDIWGINNYPGITFGDWFNVYATKSNKPMLITEYGIDALNNTSGFEYEPVHAAWVSAQWKEINNSNVTIGGSLMAYSDEWWKAGSWGTHDNGGYPTSSHPDGYANEEWWGVMRIADNGSYPDIMEPRLLYYSLQDLWNTSIESESACVIPSDNMSINGNTILCQGNYIIPGGITINTNDITLDCNYSLLNGTSSNWTENYIAINIVGMSNVTIKNCQLVGYYKAFFIEHSKEIVLTNNNISQTEYGVWIRYTNYSLVSNNTIYDSQVGIDLLELSYNNLIELNSISSTDRAMWMAGINNSILYNDILDNNGGIILFFADNNTIAHNNIAMNRLGIEPINADYNNIEFNRISDNEIGIWLYTFSLYNNVNNNLILGNNKGIYASFLSYDNYLYNNDVCYNVEIDINASGSGDENRCDYTILWNDDGTAGCTYSCNSQLTFYESFDNLSSIENNSGVLSGSPSFLKGHKNSAFNFSGSKRVYYPMLDNFNPSQGTLQFWILPPSENSRGFWDIGTLGNPNSWGIFKNNDLVYMEVRSNINTFSQATSPITINSDGKWHLVSAVWQGNGTTTYFKICLDGQCRDSYDGVIANSFPVLDGDFYVGWCGYYEYSESTIDEFKIFDYVKSDEAIRRDYEYSKRRFFNHSLPQGWNLISIPLNLTDDRSLAAALISIYGSYDNVFTYQNNSWDELEAHDEIDPTMGFWIYMSQSDKLQLAGYEIPPGSVWVYPGWNLVGFPYLQERNISDFPVANESIFSYNGTWSSYIPNRSFNSLETLKPGYGYWLKSE